MGGKIIMQHIVNIAFDFDDDKIAKKIEDDAYNDVLKMIYADIQKVICGRKNYWDSTPNPNNLNPLIEIIREEARDILMENKEVIIQAAAEGLVESVKRTKKFKGAVNEVIGE